MPADSCTCKSVPLPSESHDAATRPRWSRYDAAHGARIRMILDGEDKGSWVAYCLDCEWTADDPMPPEAAGQVAHQHEDEARHAYA